MSEEKEKFTIIILRRALVLCKFVLCGIKLFISKPYWKNNIIKNTLAASMLANAFIWFLLVQNKRNNDYPVILHYNMFSGVDYLDSYDKIYLIPFVGSVVIALNMILGYSLYAKKRLASYFLSLNAILVQVFLILASYFLIRVNS